MKPFGLLALPLLLLCAAPSVLPVGRFVAASAAPVASDVDPSPIDLALVPGRPRVIVLNHTADTASLVDWEQGTVLSTVPVGKRPFGIAVSRDGRSALVTNRDADSVTVLSPDGDTLTVTRTFSVGPEPRGVAWHPNGTTAFVALASADAVAQIDVAKGIVTRRLPVGQEPWHLALTPDGTRLAVGNSRGRTVTVIDTATGQERFGIKVLGRNLRHIAISPDGEWAYFPNISERGQGVTRENIDRGWVVGNRLTRIPLNAPGPREAITLDIRSDAVGDVDGIALSPDGKRLALTAAGTHEILSMRLPDLPFVSYGGPGDHLDPALLADADRFRRIKVGGRPLGITFAPDGKTLLVANYLRNAVQVVDTATGSVVRAIPLGGPKTPSLARRGEALFTDATRSFGNWYSCGSCHVEGTENGALVDTFNDGSLGTLKRTPTLAGVTDTAPWTWHGWRTDLRKLIRDSFTTTMQGRDPEPDEIEAVFAYLKTVQPRRNPNRSPDGALTASAKRGETVFGAKGCVSCHTAPLYTGAQVVEIGTGMPGDAYKGFNPPGLRGVYRRPPYLHDGRAKTLEEVVTREHRPSQLTGKPDCTPQETADLVAFLRSL
ncbi:MAG: c-type cytochrome [Capsulimonadales bacterium]|nr:c-type cytochrome [Capsulimonadales bacterium]